MRLLATILGILGVVCLVISVIGSLANVAWIAEPAGWWRLSIALLVLSIALAVVKPFQQEG